MYDPLTLILVVAVVLLIVILSAFLIVLTIFLLTAKRTLERLQSAISNVEDTAIRSLAPFLSFRAMFADTRGFLSAATKVVKAIQGKKSSR